MARRAKCKLCECFIVNQGRAWVKVRHIYTNKPVEGWAHRDCIRSHWHQDRIMEDYYDVRCLK